MKKFVLILSCLILAVGLSGCATLGLGDGALLDAPIRDKGDHNLGVHRFLSDDELTKIFNPDLTPLDTYVTKVASRVRIYADSTGSIMSIDNYGHNDVRSISFEAKNAMPLPFSDFACRKMIEVYATNAKSLTPAEMRKLIHILYYNRGRMEYLNASLQKQTMYINKYGGDPQIALNQVAMDFEVSEILKNFQVLERVDAEYILRELLDNLKVSLTKPGAAKNLPVFEQLMTSFVGCNPNNFRAVINTISDKEIATLSQKLLVAGAK